MTGHIGWVDLTATDAVPLRDFYQSVTGWTPSQVDMGGYSDFCMHPPGEAQPVAGICHARGVNADLPPLWLIYITVEDLDGSLRRVEAGGGKVRLPARSMGAMGRFAVIQDPAGAVCALFEAPGT
jgi:predicted enzyme related to lactoylglutathione lyase